MGISIKNGNISNNGAHGIYMQGDADLNIENVTIPGNGGHGIYHDQAAGYLQALGLPDNIDRKALATLLSELVNAHSEDKRNSILDPEGSLMKGLKIGQLTASMTRSLVTIASNPAVQAFISNLLK